MVDGPVVPLDERGESLRVAPEGHGHELAVLRAGRHAAGDAGPAQVPPRSSYARCAVRCFAGQTAAPCGLETSRPPGRN